MTDAYVDERTFYGTDSDKGYKLEKKSRRRRQLGTDEPLLLAPANGAPPPNPLGSQLPLSMLRYIRSRATRPRETPRNEKRKDGRTGPDISAEEIGPACAGLYTLGADHGQWPWEM
jgi:hypothetical protein